VNIRNTLTPERTGGVVAAIAASALTSQELQIVLAVARGLTVRQTARELCISPKTVEHHLSHIYRKLGVDSKGQLSALVIEHLLRILDSQAS
jgi:DNA-binding NarL/FixJ family response regulator